MRFYEYWNGFIWEYNSFGEYLLALLGRLIGVILGIIIVFLLFSYISYLEDGEWIGLAPIWKLLTSYIALLWRCSYVMLYYPFIHIMRIILAASFPCQGLRFATAGILWVISTAIQIRLWGQLRPLKSVISMIILMSNYETSSFTKWFTIICTIQVRIPIVVMVRLLREWPINLTQGTGWILHRQ